MKKILKLRVNRRDYAVVLFVILFAAGVLVGCYYASTHIIDAFTPGMEETSSRGIYSDFLFEYIFYFTVTFVFGLTFLGVLVIPAAILLKGVTVGLSLSYLLHTDNVVLYLQKWLIDWPFMLCAAVWLLFSTYAYSVSLHSGQVFQCKGYVLPVKKYSLFFLVSLLIFAASGVIYCFLFRIAEILS